MILITMKYLLMIARLEKINKAQDELIKEQCLKETETN